MFKLKFRSDSTRQQRVTDRGMSRESVGLGFEASSDTRSSVACTSLVLPLNYSARRVLN